MGRAASFLPPSLHAAFAARLRRELGLSFGPTRASHLDEGVARAARALGETSPGALLERVERGDGAALDALASALTVGETYFLRDAHHFELLRTRILPEAASRPGPIRLWSAGCASGEEAYSLAIVAKEVLSPADFGRVEVIGTDLNVTFLERARRGVYGRWSFRRVPDEVRLRHFVAEDRTWRVREDLRKVVRFERDNLLGAGAPPASEAAAVFCRNVFIYFDAEAVERAASRLVAALGEGGWLVPGPSDPSLPELLPLVAVRERGLLAYRRLAATPQAPAPPASQVRALSAPAPPLPAPSGWPDAGPRSGPSAAPPELRPGELPDPLSKPLSAPGAPALRAPNASLLGQARRAADEGRSDEASALVERLLGVGVLDAGAYALRATLRQGKGDLRGAAEDAERAILLDRGLAVAHLILGASRAALGETEAARRSLRNARTLLVASAALDHEGAGQAEGAEGASPAELLALCRGLELGLERGARRGGRGGGP